MSIIKSPFNFVPVSKDVYFPEWAGQVSHDIPFSDGESGYIDVELEAETPIFVRNWHTKEDQDNKTERYKSFSKDPDGRYFIPGTSLKGEVRSVLEVLSFGKMHIDESMSFATQRNLGKNSPYPLLHSQNEIRCGYLTFIDGKYSISDCGKPYRIGHREIDTYIKTEYPGKTGILSRKFCKDSHYNLNKNDNNSPDPKSAEFKHKLLAGINLNGLRFKYKGENAGRRIVEYDPEGDITGDIILTGSSSQWNAEGPKKGKYYEFVFPDVVEEEYNITEEKFNEYKFIYSDNNTFKDAASLEKGIPVFFRLENGEVKDLGLTFLYKLPYANTPYDLLGVEHKSNKYDLAETIFGRATKEKGQSLKGRVQFSHLYATEVNKTNKDVTLTLGGPKASYYPMYIRQTGGEYKTYNDNDAELAGRKRFVVRNEVWAKTSTESVDTVFRPLDKGTVFRGRIFFHNLRAVEIGAILSALTFHGTDMCRHQIGLAKPYGYGRTKVSLRSGTLKREFDWYMSEFEGEMRRFNPEWLTCPQITELLSLATPITVDDDRFRYMTLDMDNNINEFNEAKKKKNSEYLVKHSELVNSNKSSLGSIYDKYGEERNKIEQERIRLEQETLRNRFESLKLQAEQNRASGLLENALNGYVEMQSIGIEDVSSIISALKELIINSLEDKIKEQEQSGNYQEAIDVCKELQDKWKISMTSRIESLTSLLSASRKAGITDGFVLNSIGACANTIKKWKATHGGNISLTDLDELATSIREQLLSAKKDLQKKWRVEKEWSPIRKELGDEMSHQLYEMVNNE
ncbi:MAG: TIGR03986 family CRISPR-associated RAMP protein [Candidatus Cryptobacteroides sp.]